MWFFIRQFINSFIHTLCLSVEAENKDVAIFVAFKLIRLYCFCPVSVCLFFHSISDYYIFFPHFLSRWKSHTIDDVLHWFISCKNNTNPSHFVSSSDEWKSEYHWNPYANANPNHSCVFSSSSQTTPVNSHGISSLITATKIHAPKPNWLRTRAQE